MTIRDTLSMLGDVLKAIRQLDVQGRIESTRSGHLCGKRVMSGHNQDIHCV